MENCHFNSCKQYSQVLVDEKKYPLGATRMQEKPLMQRTFETPLLKHAEETIPPDLVLDRGYDVRGVSRGLAQRALTPSLPLFSFALADIKDSPMFYLLQSTP
ncbi:hypothetical protein TNCV_1843851 [Trichonephila clavipes]|nr:hypothetical protein TNCV_1843851 [Trichonephila clavipes]